MDQAEVRSAVCAELRRITGRFEAADRRWKSAPTPEGREEAAWERMDAAGDFWQAGEDLADLFLLLLRYAAKHRPEELRGLLADLLRDATRREAAEVVADGVAACLRGRAARAV